MLSPEALSAIQVWARAVYVAHTRRPAMRGVLVSVSPSIYVQPQYIDQVAAAITETLPECRVERYEHRDLGTLTSWRIDSEYGVLIVSLAGAEWAGAVAA
jgi:hypothetical protein